MKKILLSASAALVAGIGIAGEIEFSVIAPVRGDTVRATLYDARARAAACRKAKPGCVVILKASGDAELDRELGAYAGLGGYTLVDPADPRYMEEELAETKARIVAESRIPPPARASLCGRPVQTFLPVRKEIGGAKDGWFDAVYLGGPDLSLMCFDWGAGRPVHAEMKAAGYSILNAALRRGTDCQTTLWSAENGVLEGYRTGLVVVSANGGANWKDTPQDAAAGLAKIIAAIRLRQPGAEIAIVGEVPFGGHQIVLDKNAALKALCEREKCVFVPHETACADEKGFRTLAESLKPLIAAAHGRRVAGQACGFALPPMPADLPRDVEGKPVFIVPEGGSANCGTDCVTVAYPPKGRAAIETLCAIEALVGELRTRCPAAKVFLAPYAAVPEKELARLADGNRVFFVRPSDPGRRAAIVRRAMSVETRPAAARPAMRRDQPWWDRMDGKRREIAANAGKGFDIVWVGDSITHQWESEKHGGPKVFREYFGKYRTLNLGIGCDYTQHVLWRLLYDGELDGYAAKVVTLMIGTNNFESSDTAEETAEGIWRIVEVIRAKQPAAKVVLMPIFPRGGSPQSAYRKRNGQVSEIVRKLAASDPEHIIWLDFNAKFLNPDGSLKPGVMGDTLHPDEAGYRVWAESISHVIEEQL